MATVSILTLGANAQTIGCEVGVANGGAFPSSGTGGGGTFPTTLPTFPSAFNLNVPSIPPGATVVTEVKIFGAAHTWLADVQLVLTDPSGAQHNLWCRGTTTITSCDLNGDYVIVPECVGLGQTPPASCSGTSILPPGAYDQFFGSGTTAWPSGTNGIFNTPLSSIAAATGNWTLTAYDWAAGDVGTFTSFDVCFGTPLSPAAPTAAPALTAPANGAAVFGPSVNLTWAAVPCATSYEVDVDGVITASPSNSFAYTSAPGMHTWTARGLNASGAGPWATARTFNDLGAPPSPCTGTEVTTVPFTGGNGLGTNSAVYFDVDVLNPAGVNVAQFNTNANATAGTAFTLEVWTRTGTYVGFEQSNVGWNLTATGGGVSIGNNAAGGSLVEFPDFVLPQGVTGFALRIIGAGHSYTNGNGGNQLFANADISISLGKSQGTLFSSSPISPRVWNGTFRYNCSPAGPTTFCLPLPAGTTNGCVPTIAATGQPDTSHSSPVVITASGVEGQKLGLLFYGITGQVNTPWCTGGSSFLCVKAPTQRMPSGNSNGTAGLCDGTLVQDWNAYQLSNPFALGNPFNSGATVDVQGWFRDPPACKTTSLTEGLRLTYQ